MTNKTHSPLVSIVIPTYNARHLIGRTLDSCLSQTYANYEIIVVVDGSTDGTADFIRDTYGDQVKIIEQANQGPGIARNTGIDVAQGAYIKFLDSDDVLHPTYLARVMARFEEVDEQVALVYTRYNHIEGDTISPVTKPILEGDLFCLLLKSGYLHHMQPSTATVRKDALLDVGVFSSQSFAEDWELWVRIAAKYHFAGIQDCLMDYHWHGDNISNQTLKSAIGALRAYQKIRDHERCHECMPNNEMDSIIAGHHHKVAMKNWAMDNRSEARAHFDTAMTLTVEGRRLRQLYRALTYFAPYRVPLLLNDFLRRIRRG